MLGFTKVCGVFGWIFTRDFGDSSGVALGGLLSSGAALSGSSNVGWLAFGLVVCVGFRFGRRLLVVVVAPPPHQNGEIAKISSFSMFSP